ncbi:MAG: hypothetical protein RBT62_01630 [Spirochaetia bacterium]|jgi:hypothetical protein|nr:hypothetical protein [Spirochaetia bacterium]
MRSFHVVLLATLALATQAMAQDESPVIASSNFSQFERGDSMLSLSLGIAVPLGFTNPNTSSFEKANSYPGIAFALSYTGFLNPYWALAGDLAGEFIGTINEDRLFIAPLSLRVLRAFPIGAFVIAPSAGLGMAISSIGDYKHVDTLIKAGSSFLWKASLDMSYTLNIFGNIIPQIIPKTPANSRVGYFMEATLAVAYHL